jgi:hypothetical protein
MSFSVITFDKSALHFLFYDCDVNLRNRKKQIDYLAGYLDHKNVKTILIENEYIDRFYLEDYAEYYVRCFTNYPRTCKRFHFFKDITFTDIEFSDFLVGNLAPISEGTLKEKYAGFVVVKPLPETIIGRTCLEAYEEDDAPYRRLYPVTRAYDVGLFGVTLRVNKTLPFQEQDKVVSACATSALWTLFHATELVRSHHVKSPVQITKIASTLSLDKKTFPSKGLTIEMMGHVLAAEGLDPLHVDLSPVFNGNQNESIRLVKEYTYAYQKHEIPLILGVDVYRNDNSGELSLEFNHLGKHAVTICGFSINDEVKNEALLHGEFYTRADSINKIYVHDDQLGPFARIEFGKATTDQYVARVQTKEAAYSGIVTDYLCNYIGTPADQIMLPNNILGGLYHKIRIPYVVIRETVSHFNRLLVQISEQSPVAASMLWPETAKAYLWDIHLTSATKIKEEVRSSELHADDKKRLISKHLPRFLWRAKAIYEGSAAFDLLFDATDIPQGKIIVESIEYHPHLKEFFVSIFGDDGVHLPINFIKDKSLLLYKVITALGIRRSMIIDELSEKYGMERYPRYLKEHEFLDVLSLKRIPSAVCLAPGEVQELNLDKGKKYLWAVNSDGQLLIGHEVAVDGNPSLLLGHPNLLNGQKGRICGELFVPPKSDRWILNNASGRYSKFSPDNTETRLNNARILLESIFPELKGNVDTQLSIYHGKFTISTFEEVDGKIMSMKDSYRDYPDYFKALATQVIYSVPSFSGEQLITRIHKDNVHLANYFLFFAEYWKMYRGKVGSDLTSSILNAYKEVNREQKTSMASALLSGLLNDNFMEDQKASVIIILKKFKEDMKEAPITSTYSKVHSYLISEKPVQ